MREPSLADALPHRLRRQARMTEAYDDPAARLMTEAAEHITALQARAYDVDDGYDPPRLLAPITPDAIARTQRRHAKRSRCRC